jgi:hypothetical protein
MGASEASPRLATFDNKLWTAFISASSNDMERAAAPVSSMTPRKEQIC